jgi:hypothetical protein
VPHLDAALSQELDDCAPSQAVAIREVAAGRPVSILVLESVDVLDSQALLDTDGNVPRRRPLWPGRDGRSPRSSRPPYRRAQSVAKSVAGDA